MACLGGEAGGSGGVGEQSLLRMVSGHVPGRTGCGVKVVMPMLVKGVIGVGYGVDQTIVQHLGGSCRACQGVSTSSTCLDLMLCKANRAHATEHAHVHAHRAVSGAHAFCSTCGHEVMHSCVRSSDAMKRQSKFDLAVCSNEQCCKGKGKAGLTGREVGRVQHGAEVHFMPHISSSTGVGVAIHL